MDQSKVGSLIKELRNDKNLTQEQLAEHFNVSRRTVSRWETGSNLPDVDILIEMSDFFNVDLREILDGERKEKNMDKELKETVLKVAEYDKKKKDKMAKVVLIYFVLGIIGVIANMVLKFLELESTFWLGFAEGGTAALGLGAMILGILYVTGVLTRFSAWKQQIRGNENDEK